MIPYAPAIYEDELVYSWLARCYLKSGYMAYTFAAQDLFVDKNVRPSIEFINRLSPDALESLSQYATMPEVVEKHTMLPYYARFMRKERRDKALNALFNMESNFLQFLCVPKSREGVKRYLRYCPLCAAEDRAKYGETYWHRIHQMNEVRICPAHGAVLNDTAFAINQKGSPSLFVAEEVIQHNPVVTMGMSDLQWKLAKYITSVFQADMDADSDIPIGEFLHSRMEYTKYVSIRGEKKNVTLLYKDLVEFYHMPEVISMAKWQMEKVLSSDIISTPKVCALAMFLDVSASDLVRMALPERTQQEAFDAQITALRERGLNYRQIANVMDAPYDTVKIVGEGLKGKYHRSKPNPQRGGVRCRDWAKIDDETLPLVKQVIDQFQGNTTLRPKKITVWLVERTLNLPEQHLRNCRKCMVEINRHQETQEAYWAREVAWAVDRIVRDGRKSNYTAIRRLTNIRRDNLVACMPYIHENLRPDIIHALK